MDELPLGFRGEITNREHIANRIHERKRKTKRNDKAEQDFGHLCASHRLPTFTKGYRLVKRVQTPRKDGRDIPNVWVFDWACLEFKLIVEIDGGIWMPGGGAHSHPVDVTRNMLKRNDAALAGFYLLAFTPRQVKSGEAINDTERFLASRGWERAAIEAMR